MNTPSPFVPQGATPSKGKKPIIYWFLMVAALHVALFGGILLQGCKDTTTKETAPPSTLPDTSAATSNTPPTDAPPVTATSLSNAATSNTLPTAPPLAVQPVTPPPTYQPPVQPPPNVPAPGEGKEYVIAHGDMLGSIAKRNGVSLKQLMEANPGVNPKKLKVGQKIQIPGGTATATSTPIGAGDVAAAGDTTSYTVKSGDSLTKIARMHHTTVKTIMALNDMKRTSIRAGQKIKLPGAGTAAAETSMPAPALAQPSNPIPSTAATATPNTN